MRLGLGANDDCREPELEVGTGVTWALVIAARCPVPPLEFDSENSVEVSIVLDIPISVVRLITSVRLNPSLGSYGMVE